MGSLTKPYTFAAGAFAIGSQVNSDFDTLYNWVNTNGIWADASVAFSAVPSGPNLDPSANNHLTRKSYVDSRQVTRVAGSTFASGTAVRIVTESPTISYTTGGYNLLFPIAFNTTPNVLAVVQNPLGVAASISVTSTSTTSFIFKAYFDASEIANSFSLQVGYIAIGS